MIAAVNSPKEAEILQKLQPSLRELTNKPCGKLIDSTILEHFPVGCRPFVYLVGKQCYISYSKGFLLYM